MQRNTIYLDIGWIVLETRDIEQRGMNSSSRPGKLTEREFAKPSAYVCQLTLGFLGPVLTDSL